MGDINPLMALNITGSGMGGIGNVGMNGQNLRKNVYKDILSQLRMVMISKMVKPEEVSISAACALGTSLIPCTGTYRRERRRRNRP